MPADGPVLESVDKVLGKALPEAVGRWRQVGSTKEMAQFSGASLRFLAIEEEQQDSSALAQVAQLLCLKQTAKSVETLPVDADEGTRSRAARTDFSYGNECAILRLHADVLNSRGVRVPKLYHAGSSDDGGSFNLLMEALPTKDESNGGDEQQDLLWGQLATIPAGPETLAVIQWLARFHATFLPEEIGGGGILASPPAESPEKAHLWDVASHTALERRPQSELEKLPQMLRDFFREFANEDPFFTGETGGIAEKLQRFAPLIANRLRPGVNPSTGAEGGATRPFVTLCHGDLKQGNLMFRRNAEGGAEVAAIDWQWTGPGVGPADLFYAMYMGFADSVVDNYEEAVVRPYYNELRTHLLRDGKTVVEDPYPYDRILQEFKLAGLDFMRWITAARLKDYTVGKLRKAAAEDPVDVNRGSWSRSVPRLAWAWKRSKEWLEEVEDLLNS